MERIGNRSVRCGVGIFSRGETEAAAWGYMIHVWAVLDQIRQIAVIGLGRMGHGIAQSFATAGFQVRGFDANSDACKSAHRRIRRNLNELVANDMLRSEDVDTILGRFVVTDTEAAAAADAEFVVEAIAEQRTAKQEFFSRIEGAVADTTIIASNSSTFTISESDANMRRPQRAVVTHWFNPRRPVSCCRYNPRFPCVLEG